MRVVSPMERRMFERDSGTVWESDEGDCANSPVTVNCVYELRLLRLAHLSSHESLEVSLELRLTDTLSELNDVQYKFLCSI